jgi:hypothetical protein
MSLQSRQRTQKIIAKRCFSVFSYKRFIALVSGVVKTPKAEGFIKAASLEHSTQLLEFGLSAGFFQFLLGCFSIGLRHAFFNCLRSRVHQVFGFFQA